MPFDNPYHCPFGDIEILMDTRSRIADSNQWTRNAFRKGDRHCLVGALSVASQSRNVKEPSQTERRLARLLVKQLQPRSYVSRFLILTTARYRLMAFNDDYRTQHRDVLALIDRTIEHLRNNTPVHAAI